MAMLTMADVAIGDIVEVLYPAWIGNRQGTVVDITFIGVVIEIENGNGIGRMRYRPDYRNIKLVESKSRSAPLDDQEYQEIMAAQTLMER